MAVETVVRDVERASGEPASERQLPLEHLVPGREPVQGSRLLGPEGFGVGHRLFVYRVVRVVGICSKGGGRFEPAFFEVEVLDGRSVSGSCWIVGHVSCVLPWWSTAGDEASLPRPSPSPTAWHR